MEARSYRHVTWANLIGYSASRCSGHKSVVVGRILAAYFDTYQSACFRSQADREPCNIHIGRQRDRD
jgi:hypothetical protein